MKVYSVTCLENLGWGTRNGNYNQYVSTSVANSFGEASDIAAEWTGTSCPEQRKSAHYFGGTTRTAIVKSHQI